MKIKAFILTLLALATPLAALPALPTSALSGSEFKAGRIMDDVIFYNKDAMSVQQIQNFLNSKVPECDSDGSEPSEFGGGTRAQYGAAHGNPAPYTCLKDYFENTSTRVNNLEGRPIPAGAKSAAQIIWDAAQAHVINPQVLIVLLQKEQSLVTDEWPFPIQYRSAAGYGCPDTAACDEDYYGFYNQVESAAWQFRRYATLPNNYNHVAGRNNNVRWSPNASCGSGAVFISTTATAGLYNYTPYQPNQAALNNLYGTGDSCSAYGNRNFWRMFNDWFGSTLADFKWATSGYLILTKDESAVVNSGSLTPGETYLAKLHAYNTGSATWYKNSPTPMYLGSASNSELCTQTWVACNRPAQLIEDSVPPGGLGHFKFQFRAPGIPGRYYENFKPVAEFLSWTNDAPGQTFGIGVSSLGSFSWNSTGYKILRADESEYMDPGNLQPNTLYMAKLHAYNTGTATWKRSGPTSVVLATSSPTGRESIMCNAPTWHPCTRPAFLMEESVPPGGLGHFKFLFRTPTALGPHREHFKPVAEMYSWFNDLPEHSFGIIVK